MWDALKGSQGAIRRVTLELPEPWGEKTFTRMATVSANILNETIAIEAARALGREELIGPGKIRKRVANQLVKSLAEAGRYQDIPDGLDVHTKKYVKVEGATRATPEDDDE